MTAIGTFVHFRPALRVGYIAGMGRFTLKRFFVAFTLIAIGAGMFAMAITARRLYAWSAQEILGVFVAVGMLFVSGATALVVGQK